MPKNKKLLSAALGLALAGSLNLGIQNIVLADEGQQTYEATILHNASNNTYKITFTNTLPGGYQPTIILNGAENPDLITGKELTIPVEITGDGDSKDFVLNLGGADKTLTFKESQISVKNGTYNFTDNSLSPAPPEANSIEHHPSTIPGENGTPGYPSKQDKEKEKETPVATSPTSPTTDGHSDDSSPVEDPSSVPGPQPQDESHSGVEGTQVGGENHSPVSGAESGEETTHEDNGVAGQPGEETNHEDTGVQPPATQEPPVAGQAEHPTTQSTSPAPEGDQHQGSTEDGAKQNQEDGNKVGSPAAEKNEVKDNSQAAGPSTENNQQENNQDGTSDAEHSKQASGDQSASEATPGTPVKPETEKPADVNNNPPVVGSQDRDSQGPKVDSEQPKHQEENQPANQDGEQPEGDNQNPEENQAALLAERTKFMTSMLDAQVSPWLAEQNDVHKRLGELHEIDGNQGVWARTYGGKFTHKDNGYKGNYRGVQVGYDTAIKDSNWLVGIAGSVVKSKDAQLYSAKANTSLKGLTIYGTKKGTNNDYLDLVTKFSTVKTDYTVGDDLDITGNTKAHGFSFSAEYGRKFKKDNGFYVEPQAELRYSHLGSSHLKLAKVDSTTFDFDSLNIFTSRLGVQIGKQLPKGHIYSGLSISHNFGGKGYVTASGADKLKVEQNYSGTWYTVNLGATYKIGLASNMYATVEKSFGGTFKAPYRYDLGFRFNF